MTYRGLQLALVHRPEQGAVIQGSHGLRKLRWAAPGRGRRGGLRIIYYWDQAQDAIFLLFAYAKQEQGDLTPDQVTLSARIAHYGNLDRPPEAWRYRDVRLLGREALEATRLPRPSSFSASRIMFSSFTLSRR